MSQAIIPAHGGYKGLKSYQSSTIVYDFTVEFCRLYIPKSSRTQDQMVQAARSGKQNIVEGSSASGHSKLTELRLIGVARASLEELLTDYQDFLRQHRLAVWDKDDERVQQLRKLAYLPGRTQETYRDYLTDSESAANCGLSLVSQTTYLLDRQIRVLEQELVEKGDLPDRLKQARTATSNQIKWGSRESKEELLKFLADRGAGPSSDRKDKSDS